MHVRCDHSRSIIRVWQVGIYSDALGRRSLGLRPPVDSRASPIKRQILNIGHGRSKT